MQNAIEYYQIVAVDYAERNVAIARLTKRAKKPQVIEGEMKAADLQRYLSRLNGRILLIIEETTTAHYLYCELRSYVEKVLICDPFTNRLLGSGPKNDKIDAVKFRHPDPDGNKDGTFSEKSDQGIDHFCARFGMVKIPFCQFIQECGDRLVMNRRRHSVDANRERFRGIVRLNIGC